MAEKVDLSLDDIIKMKKKNNNKAGKPNKTNSKPNIQRLKQLGERSGIVRKGGPKQQVVRERMEQRNGPTMLHVSNLHFDVSNDDVRELFSEIGQIKKAAVHYDKSGRSLGTAEVTFQTRSAALKAIEKYHQLPLDGRPMNITLVPGQTSVRPSTKSRIGVKPGSGIYKRPQTKGPKVGAAQQKGRTPNNRGNKPGFQRGKREPKKEVSAEQLDADLEAYIMNVE